MWSWERQSYSKKHISISWTCGAESPKLICSLCFDRAPIPTQHSHLHSSQSNRRASPSLPSSPVQQWGEYRLLPDLIQHITSRLTFMELVEPVKEQPRIISLPPPCCTAEWGGIKGIFQSISIWPVFKVTKCCRWGKRTIRFGTNANRTSHTETHL